MTCHKFSKEFISRFVDEDLDAGERNAFISHKALCPDCSATEARFRQAGILFERQAGAMAGHLLKQTPAIFVAKRSTGNGPGINKTMKRKSGRIQAVLGMLSLAVVAVSIYLGFLHQKPLSTGLSATGPSALVNSVDAYGSSVIILETAETHHTIIWFSET